MRGPRRLSLLGKGLRATRPLQEAARGLALLGRRSGLNDSNCLVLLYESLQDAAPLEMVL